MFKFYFCLNCQRKICTELSCYSSCHGGNPRKWYYVAKCLEAKGKDSALFDVHARRDDFKTLKGLAVAIELILKEVCVLELEMKSSLVQMYHLMCFFLNEHLLRITKDITNHNKPHREKHF